MPTARQALDRISRLCAGAPTAKALREQVLAEVRRVVGFDAHAFMLTDPVTRVATSPLADVPMMPWPLLPELVRRRYLTPVNRWDRLLAARSPASSLVAATSGDRSRSELWQHVLRDLGIADQAAVAFGDRYGCWGFLDLWRSDDASSHPPEFAAADVDLLAAIAPAVTSGLRKSLAQTFVDAADQLEPVGPAVLVLDPGLRVRTQTAGAARALLQLNPPDEPMAPIPAAAYNIGGALVAHEHGDGVGPPWARVHLGGSRWVTVRADRMAAPESPGGAEPDIAVSIEPSTPTERMDLFARAVGLSAREREVLELLAAGIDSRRIAARLVLSEHTVHDHVKAVLSKTGARTRQVLLSRALGAVL